MCVQARRPYALVLLTLEYRSKFFQSLRQTWIQAHLRLSIAQSRLPGENCPGTPAVHTRLM